MKKRLILLTSFTLISFLGSNTTVYSQSSCKSGKCAVPANSVNDENNAEINNPIFMKYAIKGFLESICLFTIVCEFIVMLNF